MALTQLEATRLSRLAAALIFVTVLLGPYSYMTVPTRLIVLGNVTGTGKKYMENEGLVRTGVISDVVICLAEVALVGVLHALFSEASPIMATIASVSRAIMIVFQGVGALALLAPASIALSRDYARYLPQNSESAVVYFAMSFRKEVTRFWGLFFGLQLLVMGLMILRSRILPRFIGLCLIVCCAGYWIQGFGCLLTRTDVSCALSERFGALGTLEIALPIWLLIFGVNLDNIKQP